MRYCPKATRAFIRETLGLPFAAPGSDGCFPHYRPVRFHSLHESRRICQSYPALCVVTRQVAKTASVQRMRKSVGRTRPTSAVLTYIGVMYSRWGSLGRQGRQAMQRGNGSFAGALAGTHGGAGLRPLLPSTDQALTIHPVLRG